MTDYLEQLVAAYPCIREVWLFGSRANHTATALSDWDLLVWSDDDRLLNALCHDERFRRAGIDLFVVVDQRASQPWPADNGQRKQFWLDDSPGGFRWQQMDAKIASYIETKERSPGSFATDCRERVAHLAYRRPAAATG